MYKCKYCGHEFDDDFVSICVVESPFARRYTPVLDVIFGHKCPKCGKRT